MSSSSSLSLDDITPLTTNSNTSTSSAIKTSPIRACEDQNEFLQYLEPNPVSPPDYQTLPPGGCPKYPIYDNLQCEELPGYTPSVYKIGCIGKKLEWLNPYEPSTSRSWKNVIIELNSTQLNFYSIPTNVEPHLMSFQPLINLSMNNFEHHKSLLTNNYDYQFHKYCQRLNLLNSKKLIRSYSLQHCKVGLATDYKKKSNVLRLRIESEQLLLYFNNTNDLINWNLAINIGKDLSLDLNVRDIPKYRTVPRRRRRNRDVIYQNVNGRSRSYSDPISLINSKFSKLKMKLKRDSLPDLNNIIHEEDLDIDSFNPSSNSSTFELQSNSSSVFATNNTAASINSSSITPSTNVDETFEDDEEADDISDLHSDDEDEEDPEITRLKKFSEKWNPYYKPQTQRRYYKNCLRCIKPLTTDESWVSKNLVKPTSICPDMKFADQKVNHYVKEFIVGSHGLIPADQINV